jgi:hypothetical protein
MKDVWSIASISSGLRVQCCLDQLLPVAYPARQKCSRIRAAERRRLSFHCYLRSEEQTMPGSRSSSIAASLCTSTRCAVIGFSLKILATHNTIHGQYRYISLTVLNASKCRSQRRKNKVLAKRESPRVIKVHDSLREARHGLSHQEK